MAFAALSVDLTAKVAQFEETMQRSVKSVDKLRASAESLATGFKVVFGAVAVGGFVNLARSGLDAADALAKLSARTGVGIKDLAGYKLAADQADTSLDDVGKGIQRLSKSIGDAETGNKEMLESLQRLGVTSRDPKVGFEQLADAVKNTNDPTRLASDLAKVLGKSYVNLLPLLQGGSQALRDSAAASETFADAMARLAPDAEKFNDDLTALKQEAAGAAASLLTELAPSLSETSKRVRELLDEDKGFQALVRAIGGIAKLPFDLAFGDIKPIENASQHIAQLSKEIEQLQQSRDLKVVGNVLKGVFVKDLAELDQQILVRKNQIEALQKFGDKIYPKKDKAPEAPQDDEIVPDLSEQADKIQASLRKAFSTTPMDAFLEQFKDRRQKIEAEFRAMAENLSRPIGENIKGGDIQSELRRGQSAVQSGDAQGAQIARDRLRQMLDQFSNSEAAAGFEKRFFTDQIKQFELSIVDAEQKIAESAQQVINKKIGLLSESAEKLSVEVDGNAIVAQVKDAVSRVKDELARNPLQIPIVGVPTGISQSVDLSRAALQYGGRR